MKRTLLYRNTQIEIRRSPIHGWGVFSRSFLYNGELLEEVPFISLPIEKGEISPLLIDYRFNYPRLNFTNQVIPLGFACIYNHSNTPNVDWETDTENEIFIFRSIRDIKCDEELLVYYGDMGYWNDGRQSVYNRIKL